MKSKITSNLEKSLLQEEKKIKDKFDRADLFLTKEQKDKFLDKKILENHENQIDKLVREGVSLLKSETDKIDNLRAKIAQTGFYPSKSELFRVGILSLELLSPEQLNSIIQNLPKLKPGRKTLKS